MQREEIQEKVIAIVAAEAQKKVEEVTLESSVSNDLGLDSLDRVEIEMNCDKEFGINTPVDDISDLDTVKEIVDYIDNRLND